MTQAWAGRRADLLRAAGRLDEAGQALQAVTDPPADAVLELAEAYGRTAKHDRAAQWLAEARRQIDATAPETNRTWSLAALAEVQARIGQADVARATLDEAQAHALDRPADVFEPGYSLNRVIREVPRVAAGDLNGARRGVTILGDRHRASSVGQIIATWSVIGDRAAAEALLATIVDADSRARAAKPDPDTPAPTRRLEPDADHAITLAKEGKVDEAIVAALEIKSLDTKVRALAGIATAAPASADRPYLQLVELASKFDERSSGRPSIASALADAGHPGLALEVMEPVREIPVGEWVLIGIAKAQARAGDASPGHARLSTTGSRGDTGPAASRPCAPSLKLSSTTLAVGTRPSPPSARRSRRQEGSSPISPPSPPWLPPSTRPAAATRPGAGPTGRRTRSIRPSMPTSAGATWARSCTAASADSRRWQ